jgi:hypothetical protein
LAGLIRRCGAGVLGDQLAVAVLRILLQPVLGQPHRQVQFDPRSLLIGQGGRSFRRGDRPRLRDDSGRFGGRPLLALPQEQKLLLDHHLTHEQLLLDQVLLNQSLLDHLPPLHLLDEERLAASRPARRPDRSLAHAGSSSAGASGPAGLCREEQ